MLNTDTMRNDFPIFLQAQASGKPLIYLDNAATTQKPWLVIEAMERFYQKGNANIHRGIYTLAAEATAAYEEVRDKVQTFIGAASRKEIVFVKGTTDAINLVANSFAGAKIEKGDEILISAMEHHSNLIPWQMVCKRMGAHLRVIPMTEKGELKMDVFKSMLTDRTKLLAVVHISNTLGTINPIEEMIELAHQKNIPVLIDGAQSAASEDINVQKLDCDFFVFSGHKVFGPTGIGILYAKEEHLEAMEPYQFGGEMIRSVTFEETTYARLPHKFEAGTPNIGGVMGLGAAIDYIEKIGKEKIRKHLTKMLTVATEKIKAIGGVNIIGQADRKSCILSFTIDDIHPHDIATILNESGIAIRAGHHCTQPIMDFYKIPGTARASFSIYNTEDEIDQLVKGIQKVINIFA